MTAESQPGDQTLLEVKDLRKLFPFSRGLIRRVRGEVKAVDGVSFHVDEGETLGIVGETGCGKTTTARCVIRAIDPTSGQVLFRTQAGRVVDMATLQGSELRAIRREMQMIFQDPFSSLNPRMTLFDIVSEPLYNYRAGNRREREDRVRRAPAPRWDAPRVHETLPARLQRRTAPAHRHRPRPRPQPPPHPGRRARLRAGRLGPGASAQPAQRACRHSSG